MIKFFLYLFIIIYLTSCGTFVDNFHQQFEADDRRKVDSSKDRFEMFRKKEDPMFLKKSMIGDNNNPRRQNISSRDQRMVKPNVRRKYQAKRNIKKRHSADDLNDNDSSGSLWGGNGTDSYLFSVDNKNKIGDIVLINVLGRLKSEITLELRKAFPRAAPPPSEEKKPDAKATVGAAAEAKKAAEPAKAEEDTAVAEIHDRISSIVMETINQDHLLLKGRKHVLFRGNKRTVEVQALVARRDITDKDSVNSDKILESTINIIR